MAERFAGRYEFVDLLGDGGMGTVWRVWDHKERVYRAAKVLKQSDSASLLRFIRETSWRIDHDHLVTPIGWSAEDDRVLFTMPLVDGGTVSTLLRDFGTLPGVWVGELMAQLLSALQAVHGAGLVHRDVKPSNLLLDATGTARPRLRLTDFGIAMGVDDPRMTRVGEVIGTPGYQAPEAVRGADPEPRQDLYSVGVVALELLTGVRPPANGHDDTVDLSGIADSSLAGVIGTLVQRDPQRRYGSAQDALHALQSNTPTERDRHRSAEVEVFEQLPPLPEGWTPTGPVSQQPAPAQQTGTQQAIPTQPVNPAPPTNPTASANPTSSANLTPATDPYSVRQPAVPSAAGNPAQLRLVLASVAIGVGVLLIVVAIVLLT